VKAEFSVDDPMANSSMLVLPSTTAPDARSLSTTVALYGGTKFSRIRDEHVVGTPCVQITSLTAMGIPVSAGRGALFAGVSRCCSAARNASSRVTRLKACTRPSTASMRPRKLSTASTGDTSPVRMRSRSS
jgi:hypothetical protein